MTTDQSLTPVSDEAPAGASPAMKSFPKPSDIAVPAGAEGWEDLYPYHLSFEHSPGSDDKFWFCDSQHWPTVYKPFETIGEVWGKEVFPGPLAAKLSIWGPG